MRKPNLNNKKTHAPHTQTERTVTLSDDDCDRFGARQIPLVRHGQAELVLAHLQPRHRGNGAVGVLDLHSVRSPERRETTITESDRWRNSSSTVTTEH